MPAPQASDVRLIRGPLRQAISAGNGATAPSQGETGEDDEAPGQAHAFYGAPDYDATKECQPHQIASVLLHRPSELELPGCYAAQTPTSLTAVGNRARARGSTAG